VRTEKVYVRRRYRLTPWRAEVSENAFLNIKLRPICGVIILAMHIGLQILILMPYLMNASRKFVTHNVSHNSEVVTYTYLQYVTCGLCV